MNGAIIPLDALKLTALIHRDTERHRTFWEATYPELGISVHANSEDQARDELQKAVQDF